MPPYSTGTGLESLGRGMEGHERRRRVGGWDGGRKQVEDENSLARFPLAHLMHIVAELSLPPRGNHLTLIKEGRGDSGEKKDGSVSTLGKSFPERLEDRRDNSSVC